MTGLQYVKHRLQQDFSDRASIIIQLLDKSMEDLLHSSSLEEDLTDSFRNLLIDSVYPFLACCQAMQDAGVDMHFADHYVRKIHDELNGEFAVRDRLILEWTDVKGGI